MKLTGKLKGKPENTQRKTDARNAIKMSGMLLHYDELEMVSGGRRDDYDNTKCQWNPGGSDHVFEEGIDGRMVCKYCGVYF